MYQKIQKLVSRFWLAVCGLLLLVPGKVFGQDKVSQGLQDISGSFPGYSSTLDFNHFIGHIINILLSVVGALAVLFLIVGGFWYITSGGNEETAEKGRKTIINALIGIVVVVLSYVIVNVIVNLVSGSSSFFF